MQIGVSAVVAAALALACGCAPAGPQYQLIAVSGPAGAPPAPEFTELRFSDKTITDQASLSSFVYTESPLGGVFYCAWNSCAATRDDTFYEGFRRGHALELRALGTFADVKPYCKFGLATNGDNILVYGGEKRDGVTWFVPKLHGQVLILDPEHGTARRYSPPRRFRLRISRIFFDPQVGTYIAQDHRRNMYRLRLP